MVRGTGHDACELPARVEPLARAVATCDASYEPFMSSQVPPCGPLWRAGARLGLVPGRRQDRHRGDLDPLLVTSNEGYRDGDGRRSASLWNPRRKRETRRSSRGREEKRMSRASGFVLA